MKHQPEQLSFDRPDTPRTGPRDGKDALPYSDLHPSRWRELEEIWTDSLWNIPSRGRDGGHKLDYHGSFVPQIATQTFLRYTKAGDIVLDLFLGSGTSAIEALNLGRRCIGVELKPELVDYVRRKLPPNSLDKHVVLLQGDSASPEAKSRISEALAAMQSDCVQLLVLHPPYHDIIPFTDRPEDLSNAATEEEFLAMFRQVASAGYELLEHGRFAVLVIGDKYAGGQLIPLGFHCLQVMNDVGFITKSIVVKNIEGNERGKGKNNNLWRFRALKGGFYIFKHEYVIIFQKPAHQRIPRGNRRA